MEEKELRTGTEEGKDSGVGGKKDKRKRRSGFRG